MVTVTLVVLWLASGGCIPGNDSDVVRSGQPEGSTPGGSGATSATPTSVGASTLGRVVFIGTSLTAGYGLVDQSVRFTDRIQARVDSAGLPFEIVNAGVSGDTSADGLRKISRRLRGPASVLVIELGGNDGLRGLPVDEMRGNLQAVMDSARTHHPAVRLVLAGMEAPPNLGPTYSAEFRSVFTELARENDAVLIPFLLEGVAGSPELNQVDGIRPTVEGHTFVAETVWGYLELVLRNISGKGEDQP